MANTYCATCPQVSNTSTMPKFSVLKHIKFPYNILSFHVRICLKYVTEFGMNSLQWLTSQLAVLLDSKEFVHIIHVRSAEVLQVSWVGGATLHASHGPFTAETRCQQCWTNIQQQCVQIIGYRRQCQWGIGEYIPVTMAYYPNTSY